MMSLREYRGHAAHLADFLPWAALVGEGVVLNKDGSFQRTARFRGPDLDSATPAELAALRIDFGQWFASLPVRDQRVVHALAQGERTSGVAASLG